MTSLILYHCPPSAPSRAALLAIRNLNIDVEIREVDLFSKEQLKPEFLSINPQHVIPTINDNGFILWESRAIAQYLIESRSPDSTLFSNDIKERAVILQRLYFDLGILYTRIRAIVFPVLFLGETKITEEKRTQLNEAFKFLDDFLHNSKWVAGNHVTIADLSILSSMSSIIHIGADISPYKNIVAWYERCRDLPGFDENDQGARAYAERIKKMLKDKL